MTAGRHDITIEQGATFRLSLVWRDPDDLPINLTGFTARMQVRAKHSSPDPALLSLVSPTEITLGGVAGTIVVLATATQTAALTIKSGVYDLELVNAGGEVTRLVEGAVTVTPEVTR